MNSTLFASKQRRSRIAAAGIIGLLGIVGAFGGIARAQSLTYSSNVGGAIPDGNATGISSTIDVSDNFTISEFTSVRIDGLQHSYLGDLVITLTHGTKTVDIIDRVRGELDEKFGDDSNFSGNYTFVTTGGVNFNSAVGLIGDNDIISPGVSYATAPVGNLKPSGGISNANGLLSNFAGMNTFGAWTLNIADRAGDYPGSFTGWRFTVVNSDVNTNTTISDASYSSSPTVRVGNVSSTDVTLAAGAEVQNVQAFNSSRVVVSGGAATSLRAEDTSRLFVNYGTVSGDIAVTENGRLFMNGGSAGSVTVSGSGVANINDGTVGTVTANAGATAYVFDGTFTDIAANGGNIFIYGGTISQNTLLAYGDGAIYLYGSGFAINRSNYVRGFDFAGNAGTFYNLTGTLTDGTALNTRFFDADGGKSVVGENLGALYFNNVAVVPEAGTLALALPALGMVGAVIVRRRRTAK